MSSHDPLISIITVCYNPGQTIVPTLESVDSQTLDRFREGAFEHLIIDGASTDGTLETLAGHAREYRRTVSEPDRGLYHAMNKGLALARGEYVLFLNAGDRFHGTDALERIIDAVDGMELPGVIYGQTVLVDSAGRQIGPRHLRAPEKLTLDSFKEGMVVCHQAFVALHRIAGPFDTSYRYSADFDWCIRCLQHSRRNVYLGKKPLIDYLSEGLTTSHRRASLVERFKIMSHYYGFLPTLARHAGFAYRLARTPKGKERN